MGNQIHSSDGKARRNCEGKERKKKGGINFFFLFNNNNNDNDNDNVDIIKCYYQSHIWKGNISLEIYLTAYGFQFHLSDRLNSIQFNSIYFTHIII